MNRSFQDELQSLINRHSMENGSNTPDFLLAEYLCDCLASYEVAVTKREKWYGRDMVFPATIPDTTVEAFVGPTESSGADLAISHPGEKGAASDPAPPCSAATSRDGGITALLEWLRLRQSQYEGMGKIAHPSAECYRDDAVRFKCRADALERFISREAELVAALRRIRPTLQGVLESGTCDPTATFIIEQHLSRIDALTGGGR